MNKLFSGKQVGIAIGIVMLSTLLLGSVQRQISAQEIIKWDEKTCIEALVDKDANIRSAAVKQLGTLKATSAVPNLMAAMKDDDAETRRLASWALGEMRDPKTLTAFFDIAFWDKDPKVRAEAAKAVGNIKDTTPIKPLLISSPDTKNAPVKEIIPMTVKYYQSTRPLAYLLHDPDPIVRQEAAKALGEIGDGWAVDDLTATLSDEDVMVKLNSCEALGKIKDERATVKLRLLLTEKDANLRKAATAAIDNITGVASAQTNTEAPAKQ